jgi:hypothetical protein
MSSGVCVKFFATLLLLWTVLNRLQNVHEEWDIRQKDAIFTLDSISWHRNRCLEDSLELKNEASLWEEEGLSLSSIWRLSFNFEALFHRGSKSVEIFAKFVQKRHITAGRKTFFHSCHPLLNYEL